jgi:hypothetical protein
MGWYAHVARWRPSKGRVSLWVSLVDFSLRQGRLMFGLGGRWIFILIWVPLIMVPDNPTKKPLGSTQWEQTRRSKK